MPHGTATQLRLKVTHQQFREARIGFDNAKNVPDPLPTRDQLHRWELRSLLKYVGRTWGKTRTNDGTPDVDPVNQNGKKSD